MTFRNRTVLVTGGSHGIGRATAIRFAEEGATVIVTDVERDAGHDVVDHVRENGGAATFQALDVTDLDAFERVVASVVEEHGGLDVLVNNAGVGKVGSFDETSVEDRDRIIEVNVNGVWNGCRAAVPSMSERGVGSIINMASTIGLSGGPRFATYAMSKAAVVNLSKSLAAELGYLGIRVNAICAARIQTRRFQGNVDRQEDPEAALQAIVEQQALRRVGRPEDVANGVVFLASEEASYITGHAMAIDGGALLPPYSPEEAVWG